MPAGRSRIYAPRVKGDIDLALENARIKQTGLATYERDLARIYTPGGKLPGGSFQDIYEASTDKNYRTGTRLVMDERVFRYAKIGDCSLTADDPWAEGKGRPIEYGIGMSSTVRTVVATIVSGAITTFTAVVTLAADVEADDYAGGYFGLMTAVAVTTWGCRILGNTAADAGDPVTLILEAPLPVAITAADTATITPSPYSSVVRHSSGGVGNFESVVGMIMLFAPANGVDRKGQWVWLQTWGPYAEPQIATTHEGALTYERTLWFHDGGVMQCYTADGTHLAKQIAGFYMPESGGDLTHPVVWLTIAP